MLKNFKTILAAGVVSIAMLSPALSDGMLRISNKEDPKSADVQKTTDAYTVPLNIYDRLIEVATTGSGQSKLVPGLAESWDVSEDGKTYTFHLRKGVMFHNGEELKADDVVFTFDRMLDPKTMALGTEVLDFVQGAQDRLDGKADKVSGLEVVDDYTVKITLKEPFAAFASLMASPQVSIYNRKFTEPLGDQFGLSPETTNGTGPFKLTEYNLNDSLMLEANKDYYRGAPKLDRVLVRIVSDSETLRLLFEADELDVFDLDYAMTQMPYFFSSEKWKDQIRSGQQVGIYYYHINQKQKPFDDVRVRKAFQMGINRQELLDKNFYGKGALENGIMPRGLACYAPVKPIEYNPEKAKALLAEAGFPNGLDINLVQVSSWSSKWTDMNQVIQAQLKNAGFNPQIKSIDESAFYSMRQGGTIDNYPQTWAADFNDPDNFFSTFFSKNGTSVRGFNNDDPEVFAAIEKARTMTDVEERCKLYQQLSEKIVHDDAAWVPLFSPEHSYVVQPRVKNFVVPWNGWSDMSYYEMEVE